METQGTAQAPRRRSTFVTVVAWIFIVLGGLATCVASIQTVMVLTVFPAEKLNEALASGPGADQMPNIVKFAFAHLEGIALVMLAVSAFAMASAIGLLKRRNWARVAFITLMFLGIAWQVLSVVWQFTFFSAMPGLQNVQDMPQAHFMQTVMTVLSVVVALLFAALFAWIIRRLVSEPVKAEFGV